jgi:actin-related protein
MACNPDARKELMGNVIITGGASGFDGLVERISAELPEYAPPGTAPRTVNAAVGERKEGVWLGGSIVGSLGAFHEMWFTKAEYEEVGARGVHDKCP